MNNIKISSIVATAKNRTIGKDDKLLWHIPEDFKHFKTTTMGKPMIMGRKTFDSLPSALKGRHHIIITRTPENYDNSEYIHYCPSLESALELARETAVKELQDEIFIIGGGQIYAETMPIIDRLYLTRVERDYEGDTHFPEINWDEWNIIEQRNHAAETAKDRPACTFFTLEKK